MFAPYQLTDQQRADLRIMFPCNFPTTPSMQAMAERVTTFNNWRFTRATPQMHAEAGFFALGKLRFVSDIWTFSNEIEALFATTDSKNFISYLGSGELFPLFWESWFDMHCGVWLCFG